GPFVDPAGAPGATYDAAAIDRVEETFGDDIEGDISGWTVINAAAAGGWEAAVPVGTSIGGVPAAPSEDSSVDGSIAWVTQNGLPGQAASSNDVDGGPHYLITPAFNLEGQDGIVSYDRWFYCDDVGAVGADQLVVEITNDGVNWVTVETVTTNAGVWVRHEFLVSSFVEPTATLQVRFTINDTPNNSTTEA